MKMHEPIPKDFPVRPLTAARIARACSQCHRSIHDRGDGKCERHGKPILDAATCGHCGLSWDFGKWPTPSQRCAFESFHIYREEEPEDIVPSPGLTDRELATVLAALRQLQGSLSPPFLCGDWDDASRARVLKERFEHFTDVEPLTLSEIDDLCERLNCVKLS